MSGGAARDVDVAIIGNSVGALAAGVCAAQRGLSTALVMPGGEETFHPRLEWLAQRGAAGLAELKVTPDEIGGSAFAGVTLYSADFSRQVPLDDADLRGWIIDEAALRRRLLNRALELGAIGIEAPLQSLALGESAVVVNADANPVRARLAQIDDGVPSRGAELARFGSLLRRSHRAAHAEFSAGRGQGALGVILGAARSPAAATLLQAGGRRQLSVVDPDTAGTARLDALLAAGRKAGVLDTAAPPATFNTPCPAGAALEMDAHVGKRTLLIGDSGGFVAAFSCDRIYPAIGAARVAAEVAQAALAGGLFQDVLGSFENRWRSELADYLRHPNTDLSLLAPLVFGPNRQMALRVARAFLLGEKF
ncbi:MAG: hypothetical protein CHACPFDD_04087 [Phycisphaerae bacterium]|nr:hypothetical protein [Phycisphaerae bacterium]